MNDPAPQNSAQLLQKVSAGDTTSPALSANVLIRANKIRNHVLRALAKEYINSGMEKEQIVNMLLAFDEVAEKDLVDEDFFKKIAEDKDFLKQILTNGN